ncbi:mavicyanin-like [Canna indica]|uniref:Mavicyanin-like n=1 Tax=Canna indica TaxID=4628 RepID=A0AAQ3Q306_9LILI|nr:mavicyanin-like [Canna indica]
MVSTSLLLCSTSLAMILLALIAQHSVGATEYIVGDENRWTTGTNYLAWSEKYNFTVGDVLVFKYVKGQHDVFRVTEETFRSCNSSSGVLETHATGDDHIALVEAKRYWFICNVSGHCLGGMKFGVSVASLVEEGPAVPPAALPPPAKGGAAAAAGGGSGLRWLLTIGLSMGFLNYYYYY